MPVFGLPGNPVSSLVSFELFARPALLPARWATPTCTGRWWSPAPSRRCARKPDGKLHLDRVILRLEDGRYVATSVRAQASNALAATATADGLALVPDGTGIAAGGEVLVQLLD